MIPFLTPKIWYAFQGLPSERVGDDDRIPWSKCSVMTNNLMYILQFEQLTEAFMNMVNKREVEENKGLTFNEYVAFFNKYLKTFERTSEHSDRNSFPNYVEHEKHDNLNERLRGNTVDFLNVVKHNIHGNPKSTPKPDLKTLTKNFDEYSWTLYRTMKLPHLNSQSILNDEYLNLWLLFITYSIKEDNSNKPKIPVVMDILEAKYWSSRIQELLGARSIIQDMDVQEETVEIGFLQFFDIVQDVFKNANLNDAVIKIALETLAEEALEGMTIKGPVRIDRCTRYCVLKSYDLMMYNSKNNTTNLRSCVNISPDTEIIAGTNKIQLKSSGPSPYSITMEINDIQQLNKWRTALTDAISFSKSDIQIPAIHEALGREETRRRKRDILKLKRLSLQCKLEEERKVRFQVTEAMEQQLNQADKELQNFRQQIEYERMAKDELLKESEMIRDETDKKLKSFLTEQQAQYEAQLEKLEMIEKEKELLNEQLQATKEEKSLEEQKRTCLEEKHSEAQQMLTLAQEKILSLKELGEKLEKALEEERQAKEEEEAVRNATLALLEEEQRSKAKLEELLDQQNNTITNEILKSTHFAEALENERMRIQQIAEEKEKLSKQLEDSQQRMQTTGLRVKNLDSKVSKIAENVFGKEDSRIPVSHRGQGFIAEFVIPIKNVHKPSQTMQTTFPSQSIDNIEEENNIN